MDFTTNIFHYFSIISTNDGIGNTFGNMYYVKCLSTDQQPIYESYPIVDNDYQTSCFDTADYHPFAYFINESTPLSILLDGLGHFSFISVVFMKNAISNLKIKANLERRTEARAMFIGFTSIISERQLRL